MELKQCIEKAKKYIDGLTVKSSVNQPEKVVETGKFFSWDNEKRSYPNQPYLFQWSYYNGVVFEGLYDIYAAQGDEVYLKYVAEYLNALIGDDGKFIFERAGYVDCHGADCYKTAALLARFKGKSEKFDKVLADLYRDLTDETEANADGNIITKQFCDDRIGGNYWHSWRGGKPPKRYKLWLDGIYMLQPFLARYAAAVKDSKQIEKIAKRIEWVAENFQAKNGLYYHAGNDPVDVCNFFWTRAIGWYCMAIVDVAEPFAGKDDPLSKRVLSVCSSALKKVADGLKSYQLESGLWKNLADLPLSETNREETSGTSMICYTILKGIRLGLISENYADTAIKAFCGICENKLNSGLGDIYFKASASGINNYENPDDYLVDEGKGVGPFIMAYSEVLLHK